MKEYLEIVDDVLSRGKLKGNRTGIRAITRPNRVFTYDMSKGFPLLTTKRMPIKTIAVELEGFLKGITSKKWYQERGCKIWNEWANPKAPVCNGVPLDKWPSFMWWNMAGPQCQEDFDRFGVKTVEEYKKKVHDQAQAECDDLGPIYGYQWRSFNMVYDDNDDGCFNRYDQLKTTIRTLETNPDDRRMVCSAWNPIQISRMALPPCHLIWGLVHIEDELSLWWSQRSCDLMLGVPFNIASYALLLCILCKQFNMKPGNLTGLLADCHIYENHVDTARAQLSRAPYKLPTLDILSDKPFDINDKDELVINWTHQDIKLNDYLYHPKLPMNIAI